MIEKGNDDLAKSIKKEQVSKKSIKYIQKYLLAATKDLKKLRAELGKEVGEKKAGMDEKEDSEPHVNEGINEEISDLNAVVDAPEPEKITVLSDSDTSESGTDNVIKASAGLKKPLLLSPVIGRKSSSNTSGIHSLSSKSDEKAGDGSSSEEEEELVIKKPVTRRNFQHLLRMKT